VHGLAGKGVVVPRRQRDAVVDRYREWSDTLNPTNSFEQGLMWTISLESVRVHDCQDEERLIRDSRGRRAMICWPEERKAETAQIARSLPDQPEVIAARLSLTAPGCDWLIKRWRALGSALDKNGTWTEKQDTLAMDLLGLDATLRDLHSPTDPADETSPLDHRQALVDDQLERLLELKAGGLDAIEETDRSAAIHGVSNSDDRMLKLIRRYESASFRRMKWALDLMQKKQELAKDLEREMSRSFRNLPTPPARARRRKVDDADQTRIEIEDAEPSRPGPIHEPATPTVREEPVVASASTKVILTHHRLLDSLLNEATSSPASPAPVTPQSRVQTRQTLNRNANLVKKLRGSRRGRLAEAPAPAN
jgi:hypothetical protein